MFDFDHPDFDNNLIFGAPNGDGTPIACRCKINGTNNWEEAECYKRERTGGYSPAIFFY